MKAASFALLVALAVLRCYADESVSASEQRVGSLALIATTNAAHRTYSAADLAKIVQNHAIQTKIDFDFKSVTNRVFDFSGKSNVIALVVFHESLNKPAYIAEVGSRGEVLTNYVAVVPMMCGPS